MLERARLAAATLVAAASAAACASIPTGGPVHLVTQSPGAAGVSAPDLSVLAQHPLAGESPRDVVRGFLEAAADFDNNYAVARSFLAPATAAGWRPQTGERIYNAADLTVSPVSHGSVLVSATSLALIDPQGDYRPDPGRLQLAFGITRVDGQWRISRLPNGLLLSSADFQHTYRPVSVYFLAPTVNRVAADPLYVRARLGGLPSALVRALLAGPTPAVAGSLRTAVPRGTTLNGPVTISAGVADVPLSSQVATLSASAYRALSAQLVWTLGQLGGVNAVRIQLTGPAPPGPALATAGLYASYNPDVLPGGAPPYAVVSGQLRRLGDHAATLLNVAGVVGTPAITGDGRLVAAVLGGPDGETLAEAPPGGALKAVSAPAQSVLDPSFAADGSLWAVMNLRNARQEVIRVFQGTAEPVSVPGLQGLGPVTALAVSRDGARVALIAGSALFIGPVTYGPSGLAVEHLTRVLPGVGAVSALAWRDSLTVAVLATVPENGSPGTVVEPLFVSVDGSSVTSLDVAGLPAPPSQLAAAPGSPVLLDAGGAVYAQGGSGAWAMLAHGRDPAYPGG